MAYYDELEYQRFHFPALYDARLAGKYLACAYGDYGLVAHEQCDTFLKAAVFVENQLMVDYQHGYMPGDYTYRIYDPEGNLINFTIEPSFTIERKD